MTAHITTCVPRVVRRENQEASRILPATSLLLSTILCRIHIFPSREVASKFAAETMTIPDAPSGVTPGIERKEQQADEAMPAVAAEGDNNSGGSGHARLYFSVLNPCMASGFIPLFCLQI